MDAESVMELFDHCWFQQEIFKKQANSTASRSSSSPDKDRHQEISDEESRIDPENLNLSRSRSILSRSMSDQLSSQAIFTAESTSPHSVLRHLQTVPSGKEITEEVLSSAEQGRGRVVRLGKKKRQRALSKSLSELEFEEVKGFMDLGFVFSEEDKESNLASIIPGLQKIGKKKEEIGDGGSKKVEELQAPKSPIFVVSRPYLSETWEWLDTRRKEEKPLMKWNFPGISNEIDMKDNLKWWAHTVASAVR